MIYQHVEARGHEPVTITVQMLRYWWSQLNREVFGGVLKVPQLGTELSPEYPDDASGLCWPLDGGRVRIEVKTKYASTRCAMLNTLAHEMVHQYQHQLGAAMHHGESFEAWREPIKNGCGLTI
jgi:hypothetical protein